MKQTSKQRSVKQERRIAQDLGGRTTPASGARWGARRDVKSDAWLVEAKTTGQPQYRVDDRDLLFLRQQSYRTGRTPAYVVEFQGRGELAVIPLDVLDPPPQRHTDSTAQAGFTLRAEDLPYPPTHHKTASGDYAVIPYEQFLALVERFIP